MKPKSASPAASPTERTFGDFMGLVFDLLDGEADRKGYNGGGPDAPNPLYEFVADMNGGPQHALSEIIYKVKRYAMTRDEADLIKIAAWACLAWRYHRDRA
jgi:hypothetical protein